MTSNLGSAYIQQQFASLNDSNHDMVIENTRKQVQELLKQTIKPEFLNRIDETIMFLPLNREEIAQPVFISSKIFLAFAFLPSFSIVISEL